MPKIQIDNAQYVRGWADELRSRANRVRNLIADAHWPSDGAHKEFLVRDFLVRYAPPQVTVTHGFVRAAFGAQRCSPEIDVLLADLTRDSPLFAEGGLHIVGPRAALAHLQIKSGFQKSSIDEALENIAGVQFSISQDREAATVWRGAIFFDVPESRTKESVRDTVVTSIMEFVPSIDSSLRAIGATPSNKRRLDLLPNSVAGLERFAVFIDESATGLIRLRIFELSGFSAACAVVDLLSSVRCQIGGHPHGNLDAIIADITDEVPLIYEFEPERVDA